MREIEKVRRRLQWSSYLATLPTLVAVAIALQWHNQVITTVVVGVLLSCVWYVCWLFYSGQQRSQLQKMRQFVLAMQDQLYSDVGDRPSDAFLALFARTKGDSFENCWNIIQKALNARIDRVSDDQEKIRKMQEAATCMADIERHRMAEVQQAAGIRG